MDTFPELLHAAAAISTGGWVFCLLLLIMILNASVPEDDRSYMDPITGRLKLVWPLIRVIAYYICTNFSNEFLERTDKQLQRTGVGYVLNAEQFIALRFVSALLTLGFFAFLIAAMQWQAPLLYLLALPIGFMLPIIWLSDTRKKREKDVILAMPSFLDFITMAVEAGLNLTGALGQAMEKGPTGPLRNEFAIVLRDLRSGVPRSDALRRMADRLDINEVSSFVSAMIQAERMGSSLANVLRIQSDQRRNERFARAEKTAMEAPVKLVFPLIIFIFPVTFVVLGFPIVMKFMAEGMF